MVWKGSKRFGVGIASKTVKGTIRTYIVARYNPPGNFAGEYLDNVGNDQGRVFFFQLWS